MTTWFKFCVSRSWSTTVIAVAALFLVVLAACSAPNPSGATLSAPTSLEATPGDARAELQWQYSGAEPVTYTVYRSTTYGDFGDAIVTGVGSRSFSDDTVNNGVTYTYRVAAVDPQGAESAPSNAATATPSAATFDGTLFDPPAGEGEWLEGFTGGPYDVMDAFGGVVDRKLYAIGGKDDSGYLKSTAIYDSDTDTWSIGAPLPDDYPGVEDAATVSHGDKIYVFGGGTAWNGGAVQESAVYDTVSDSWQMLPPMPTGRLGATAAELDGRVYVIGGMNTTGTSLSSMDVFDLSSETWVPGPHPSMLVRRDNAASEVMFGRIFVFGGRTRLDPDADDTLSSAEQFDPATETWSLVSSMPTGRRAMNAVPLHGRVLVFGGEATEDGGTYTAVEEYDPIHDSWRTLTSLPVGRHGAVAGRVGGQVFVATGGVTAGDSYSNDVVSFRFEPDFPELPDDLSFMSWQNMSPAPTGKLEAQGGVIEGQLYTFGGFISFSTYRTTFETARYDPTSDTWTQLADMPQAWTHAGTVVLGHHFLLAGGYLNPNDRDFDERDSIPDGESTILRYDVDADAWNADIPVLPEPRGAGGFVRMGRNLHFFSGNSRDRKDMTDHWILSLDHLSRGWQRIASVPSPRNHLATVVQDDLIYLIGGQTGSQDSAVHRADVFRYDPKTDVWTSLTSMPYPVSHHGYQTFVDADHIFVFGGEVAHNNYVDSVLRYSIHENTWMEVASMPTDSHSAVGGYIDGAYYIATGTHRTSDTLRGTP